MRSNEPCCYCSTVVDPLSTGHETTVCALADCDVAVAQPPRGGRRRLYCSNAHRAEARRRRIAGSPEVAPGDVVASVLQRLDAVLEDLRAHEAVLRSVDPNRQAVDAARIRAEASAAVFDAQRVAAKATEDAASSGERLAAERSEWERERAAQRAELEELRTAVARAREQAASTQDAFDAELAAHRGELEGRDHHAARVAAANEEETSSLFQELERAKTRAAAAEARTEAGDRRAATAEAGAREAAEHAARSEAVASELRVAIATAQASAESATQLGDRAERLLEQAHGELQTERHRHDVSLAQLHDQLGELIARRPARQPAKKTSPRKRATTASQPGAR